MNRLRQMSLFAHIVQAGSISKAAENLDLSKSVLSQHLKALETELDVILLKRTTRRQSLTNAGKKFYESCKEVNQIADTAWLNIQDDLSIPKGPLRITAPNALMETLVTSAIETLLKKYPDLEPNLISSDQHLDLHAENIDIAIRVGPSSESTLKQKRIGAFRDILCGDKDYVAAHHVNEQSYIANAWQGRHINHVFKSVSDPEIHLETDAKCITNSFHTCLSLLKAGVGVGLIPDFYFKNESHSLKEVFPNHELPLNSVYALHPFGKHMPLTVSIFLEKLEETLNNVMQY